MVRHADELLVDTSRIAGFGESAGAITSCGLAYVDSEGHSGNPGFASNVTCTIALSGYLYTNTTGGLPAPRISSASPPYMDIHGTADPWVPISMAEQTASVLSTEGASNWLAKIPGGVHEPYQQLWNESLGFGSAMYGFLVNSLRLDSSEFHNGAAAIHS